MNLIKKYRALDDNSKTLVLIGLGVCIFGSLALAKVKDDVTVLKDEIKILTEVADTNSTAILNLIESKK